MSFFWPENYKEQIDEIRVVVGRLVTVNVQEGSIPCSGCSLDPVTGHSTDSFCTICNGYYWIPVYSGYTISGHIRWIDADSPRYTAGGIIPEGDCKVTVEYTAENLDRVERSYSWVVDGKLLYLEKFQLKGIRGDADIHGPNRVSVYLKEEDRSG